jgi:hypothetical protein
MPPDGGGAVLVVVGGGGGGALFVVVGGGAGAGVGLGDDVVGAGAWLVVEVACTVGVGAGGRTITTSLMCTCGFEARATLRSWRPAATPWNVILGPALRLIEPRT